MERDCIVLVHPHGRQLTKSHHIVLTRLHVTLNGQLRHKLVLVLFGLGEGAVRVYLLRVTGGY